MPSLPFVSTLARDPPLSLRPLALASTYSAAAAALLSLAAFAYLLPLDFLPSSGAGAADVEGRKEGLAGVRRERGE